MPRREKSLIAAKRRFIPIPTEASVDRRQMAKHPIQHRGAAWLAPRKRGRRPPAR
jgi:hypothetical protein